MFWISDASMIARDFAVPVGAPMRVISRALLWVIVCASASGHGLPSAHTIKSPDGKWALFAAPSKSPLDARLVLCLRKNHGVTYELRRVEPNGWQARWSPDSSRLAVSDRWASDRSDVLICSVPHPRFETAIAKLFPRTAIPREDLSGHCYFEAVKWLTGSRLQIRISGHRDEYPADGFEYEFVFDLVSGDFVRLPKI